MITDSLTESEIQYGTQIGRFVVVGELGSGGMGVVYSAHDRELDRKVALKVLRGAVATDEDRTRMLREGQAMARVTHPNVITVYEVGLAGSLVFLAQELLDGGTLGKWLEQPRTQNEVINKFIRAGRGLAAAHAAGLVHRDFKPDNVLLGKDGRVRVADFGLARAVGSGAAETRAMRAVDRHPATDPTRTPMSPLTRTGAVMGTPMFMAPEQHNGERADARSDQFSFCVALYHALYGGYPYEGKTSVALADAVINGRLEPPPKGHRVPARLRKILLRGLATRPDDRYPSMEALIADLLADPGRKLRRIALIGGLIVLIAGGVIGGYAASRMTGEPEPIAKPVVPEVKTASDEHPSEWLSAALETGQLADAIEKYDMAAALKQQAGNKPQTAIALSAAAVARVQRGRLEEARSKLATIDADKGNDRVALAYADLAAASIGVAGGDLPGGLEHAKQCAAAFASGVPELAAVCFELAGDAAAEAGDDATARKAYREGVAAATRAGRTQLATRLELAGAQLDLDAGHGERAAARVDDLRKTAAENGAAISEAHAQIALAWTYIAQADTQKALDVLGKVKPALLDQIQIKTEYDLASGETTALLGDATGLERIDATRAAVEKQGYVGLTFEARLARVAALTMTSADTAASEQKDLITDARARGYTRIAHLAETIGQR